SRHTAAHKDVQVVQSAGPDAKEDVRWTNFGIWKIAIYDVLDAALRLDDRSLHGDTLLPLVPPCVFIFSSYTASIPPRKLKCIHLHFVVYILGGAALYQPQNRCSCPAREMAPGRGRRH